MSHDGFLSTRLHVHDPDSIEFEYSITAPAGLSQLRLGLAGGHIVFDLPLDPDRSARFLHRLAETATTAATQLQQRNTDPDPMTQGPAHAA